MLALLMLFATMLGQTDAPATQHVVLTARGQGVQIYSCKAVDGATQWVFDAPEARLLNAAGAAIGSHGAGPVWKLKDGSSVKGKVVEKKDAPGVGNIPWLLLKAENGSGTLKAAEYIRRSGTQGGMAPGGSCKVGKTVRVPYTATYIFYAAR